MIRTTRTALTLIAASILVGCGAPADPGADPADPGADPAAGSDPTPETPCVVGTWQLDVPDYGAQAEGYLLGLGIPIVGFAMDGAGTMRFTADGLVAGEIGLTMTGTIVAGDAHVPFDIPSSYTGSGDWGTGADADTIDLANWANVPDPDVPVDPAAPPLPAIDYTDIPSVTAECSADTLLLQAPGAPLSSLWHR